jgi:asparagine synthase (glutamine-hydrolysing)
VSQQTKQHVTVALNGDGGDELFAGYERYQAVRISEIYNKIPTCLRENLINKVIDFLPDSINPKNRMRRIKRFINGASKPINQRYLRWIGIFNDVAKDDLYSETFWDNVNQSDPVRFLDPYLNNSNGMDLLDRLLLTDTMTYLPGDLLVKVDIASMANSLEARSPFLDHKLMEFAASIPSAYKIKKFVKKNILKKVASKLIPPENIHRRKMGFGVPVGRWFREDLKSLLRDTLLSAASQNRGYFKPEIVKRLVEDHIRGACDYSFQLWALLMLELWHLKFIDKPL